MTSIYSTDFSDKKNLEKYSSAFTLSDMEIFIFPELFYPLVLANIMSPIIWEWRNDPWFKDVEKKSFTYKSNRIKQFIIQNYIYQGQNAFLCLYQNNIYHPRSRRGRWIVLTYPYQKSPGISLSLYLLLLGPMLTGQG
jgi:hypothetical protein